MRADSRSARPAAPARFVVSSKPRAFSPLASAHPGSCVSPRAEAGYGALFLMKKLTLPGLAIAFPAFVTRPTKTGESVTMGDNVETKRNLPDQPNMYLVFVR